MRMNNANQSSTKLKFVLLIDVSPRCFQFSVLHSALYTMVQAIEVLISSQGTLHNGAGNRGS